MARRSALIHGIINATVWFGTTDNLVGILRAGVALLVEMNLRQCLILAVAIDDEVFYPLIILLLHTPDGAANEMSGVVADGGYRESYHIL